MYMYVYDGFFSICVFLLSFYRFLANKRVRLHRRVNINMYCLCVTTIMVVELSSSGCCGDFPAAAAAAPLSRVQKRHHDQLKGFLPH